VFVEQCSISMCSSWVHCTLCRAPIIAGVEYGVEQWGGKLDGTVGVALTCVTGTVVQGCASYYVSRALTSPQSCMSKSSVATFLPF